MRRSESVKNELEERTILIIGGTSEGKLAATVCDEAAKTFFYSTKYQSVSIESAHAETISGGMDAAQMSCFCSEQQIDLIVDAAHPFAGGVHATVGVVGQQLKIPLVRYERPCLSDVDSTDLVYYFDTFPAIEDFLLEQNLDPVLALTGINSIPKLARYIKRHTCYLRIMRREESIKLLENSQFPPEHILYYEDTIDKPKLLKELSPQAIITKDSGSTGGFEHKLKMARDLGVPLLVLNKPKLPYCPNRTVYGPYGLRRAIEDLMPSFFALKTGYTSGSCVTAASKAALICLLHRRRLREVEINLPSNEPISIPIESVESISSTIAEAKVIKVSGDDPDVTNGLEFVARVSLQEKSATDPDIRILGGEGVGRVTLPGLGIEIGDAAINKTPRSMIRSELSSILKSSGLEDKFYIEVLVSVPKGAEVASKTFNPKLGITGGISIIGTSGIVKPFSEKAFLDSIRREIQVARAMQVERLVINSGAKSEKYVKASYPNLPSQAFIHYGNFIGDTIKVAVEEGFHILTLGLMLGKAVKLAEGHLNTHSKLATMNKSFLRDLAIDCGLDIKLADEILNISVARSLWTIIPGEYHKAYFGKILSLCQSYTEPLFEGGDFTIMLIGENGEIFQNG